MLGIIAGMDLVTRSAGSPFNGLVDVTKVEILIAVAKVRQGSRIAVERQCFFMTAKAQAVFFLGERGVKISGIRTLQQAKIVRAVRVVTGRAIFLSDRPVPITVALQPFFHVHDFSRRCFQLFVMTREAKIRRGCPELFGKIRVMGIVTIQTLSFDFVGVMLCLRLRDVIALFRMTTETEGRHGIIQAQRVRRSMGIVTVRAVERCRRVAKSLRQKLFLFLRMAGETEILSLGNQSILIRRAVRIMTGNAVTHGYRAVHFLVDRLIVDVALKAKLARWAGLQPIAIGRLMRIVAGGAQAVSHRAVNNFLCVEPPLVTEIAKLSLLPRKFEAMLSRVKHIFFVQRLVAAHTLAGSYRPVDIALLGKIAVATEARLLLGGGPINNSVGYQEPKRCRRGNHQEPIFCARDHGSSFWRQEHTMPAPSPPPEKF